MLFTVSCGPSLCDCIKAEKKDDGVIQNTSLRTACETLMNEKKDALKNVDSDVREEIIKDHKKEMQRCLQ